MANCLTASDVGQFGPSDCNLPRFKQAGQYAQEAKYYAEKSEAIYNELANNYDLNQLVQQAKDAAMAAKVSELASADSAALAKADADKVDAWIQDLSTADFIYISPVGGEISIQLPSNFNNVRTIYVNGSRQTIGDTFSFDPVTHTVNFLSGNTLQAGDKVIAVASTIYEQISTVAQTLQGPGGADYVKAADGKSVQEYLDSLVNLHKYYLASDNGDWSLAFQRAFIASPSVLVPLGSHVVKTTVDIPSGARIVGLGAGSIVKSPDAADAGATNLVTVFKADAKSDIIISNLTVDGGVREINTTKTYRRTMRFSNCNGISLLGVRVINNADWSTSFEGGSNITVKDYYQRSYVYTDPAINLNGGRDGLHFMDCSNVYASNLDIMSGDDCVGITTTGTDMDNITIKGLRGSSNIASLVIFNEEKDSSGNYYSCNLTNIKIEDVVLKSGGVARNLVRIIGYGANTTIKGVHIKGVSGNAFNSYGLWIQKASDIFLDDISVGSQQAHGIYLNLVDRLFGNASGVYLGANASASFMGININNMTNSTFEPISYDCYSYGMQALNCTDCTFIPNIHNCGAGLFSANNGGNLRVANCTNIDIPSGRAVGLDTVSYWGFNQSGNTNLNVGVDFVFRGKNNSSLPIDYYLRAPVIDVKFKEDSSGNIINHLSVGGTVTRNSIGNYTINFTSPMRSTNFSWTATAYKVGSVVSVRLGSAVLTTSITLQVVDTSNALTFADHIEFKAFNAGS